MLYERPALKFLKFREQWEPIADLIFGPPTSFPDKALVASLKELWRELGADIIAAQQHYQPDKNPWGRGTMFRHRIAIEKRVELGRNTVGEVFFDWQKTCETWAEIKNYTITIRYKRDLQPGYRVVIGNSFYEIVGVIDRRGKTRLAELQVKEISGARENASRATTMNSFRQGLSSEQG